MIEFRSLGSVELTSADGAPLERVLAQPKRLALLAYLAAARPAGFHRRDTLLALLWPELDQAHARPALRIALHFLRRELGARVLRPRGDAVALAHDACWCDVAAFATALRDGRLGDALSLYRGPFLGGLHIADAPDFDAWLEGERDRLRRQAHDAAGTLSRDTERAGDGAAAARWCRVALELDPYDEASLQNLVRVLDALGDRAGAVREYESFVQRVAASLGVEPSPESRALIAGVRARAAGSTRSPRPAGVDPGATPVRGAPGRGAGQTRSILVLPFANIGPDAGDEYFADGLTDELITDLSQVRSLRVISRTSAMRLKHREKDLSRIAHELNVGYVLEGSVRRIGNSLRITAQLIDAANDTHVWAEKYAGTLDDVFAIQEKLSRTIVEALQVALTSQESARLRQRPIDNPHAYECYLRARQDIGLFSPPALDRAIQLIDRALGIVGDDPLLFATKAYATVQRLHAGSSVEEGAMERAEECVARVFALAPDSYHGHLARGLLLHIRGDFQSAARDLKRVLVENPSNADSLLILGYIYALSGQEAAAKPLFARLLDVDPLTPLNHCMPGFVSVLEGRPERALESYRRFYELAPESPAAHWFYAWALAWNDRIDEVATVADHLAERMPGTAFASAGLLIKYALRGQRQHAIAAVTPELRSTARGAEMFSREMANFLALAGEKHEALFWLENANRLGFINYPFLAERDRFLDNLRNETRFQALLDGVRGRWEAFQI